MRRASGKAVLVNTEMRATVPDSPPGSSCKSVFVCNELIDRCSTGATLLTANVDWVCPDTTEVVVCLKIAYFVGGRGQPEV